MSHQAILVLSKNKEFKTDASHLFDNGAERCLCDYVGDEYNEEERKTFYEYCHVDFNETPITLKEDRIIVSGKQSVWNEWKKHVFDNIAEKAKDDGSPFFHIMWKVRHATRAGHKGIWTLFFVDGRSDYVEYFVDFVESVLPDFRNGDVPDQTYYITQIFDSHM